MTTSLVAPDLLFLCSIEGEGGDQGGGGGGGDQGGGGGADDKSTALGGGGADTQSGGGGDDTGKGAGGEDSLAGGGGDDTAKGGEGDDALDGPPETYEWQKPEGFEGELDTEALTQAEPIFRELNLNNEQANKLVGLYAEMMPTVAAKYAQAASDLDATVRADWLKEAKADKDIGGAKFDETLALSAKALDTLGYPKGSPFRKLLDDSGLGNHPEMIRAFRKIGELVGEDGDFVRTGAGGAIEHNPARVMYPNNKPKEA